MPVPLALEADPAEVDVGPTAIAHRDDALVERVVAADEAPVGAEARGHRLISQALTTQGAGGAEGEEMDCEAL